MRSVAATIALTLTIVGGSLAVADDSHPSFFQSAIFFMTGREPPNDVEFRSDTLAVVHDVILPNDGASPAHVGRYEYSVKSAKDCTLLWFRLEPPYETGHLEFTKLPSRRAMKFVSADSVLIEDIPAETWCKSKARVSSEGDVTRIEGTSICGARLLFNAAPNQMSRRLTALDYIRKDFCPEQPDPPPPPRKPY
jgi:hypothetical protein